MVLVNLAENRLVNKEGEGGGWTEKVALPYTHYHVQIDG